MSIKLNKIKLNKKAGFTLVELLITITMFVIITGVVLVNSNTFDNSVLLHNFAYDVALTIKQAQSYGVNVRENSSGSFNYDYGVYFDLTQSNVNYVLFNNTPDVNNNYNKIYNDPITTCSASGECIQKYTIRKGTFIQSICVGDSELTCDPTVKQLSILFHRPKLDAYIYINNVYTGNDTDLKSYAKIIFAATNGATSTVVVTSVGQIYIKK